jgi:hypothetical protein
VANFKFASLALVLWSADPGPADVCGAVAPDLDILAARLGGDRRRSDRCRYRRPVDLRLAERHANRTRCQRLCGVPGDRVILGAASADETSSINDQGDEAPGADTILALLFANPASA